MNRFLPVAIVIALVIAFRVLGAFLPESQPNLQPLAALFFCGALLARGWKGFALPLAIWAVTYPLGFGHQGSVGVFLTTMVAFGMVFFLGKSLSQKGFLTMLLGSLAGALLFHLVTNGMAWAIGARYDKTLAGLWQSLWLGAPGDIIPSWVFLRNFAAANLVFTAVFMTARLRLPALKLSAKEGLATAH